MSFLRSIDDKEATPSTTPVVIQRNFYDYLTPIQHLQRDIPLISNAIGIRLLLCGIPDAAKKAIVNKWMDDHEQTFLNQLLPLKRKKSTVNDMKLIARKFGEKIIDLIIGMDDATIEAMIISAIENEFKRLNVVAQFINEKQNFKLIRLKFYLKKAEEFLKEQNQASSVGLSKRYWKTLYNKSYESNHLSAVIHLIGICIFIFILINLYFKHRFLAREHVQFIMILLMIYGFVSFLSIGKYLLEKEQYAKNNLVVKIAILEKEIARTIIDVVIHKDVELKMILSPVILKSSASLTVVDEDDKNSTKQKRWQNAGVPQPANQIIAKDSKQSAPNDVEDGKGSTYMQLMTKGKITNLYARMHPHEIAKLHSCGSKKPPKDSPAKECANDMIETLKKDRQLIPVKVAGYNNPYHGFNYKLRLSGSAFRLAFKQRPATADEQTLLGNEKAEIQSPRKIVQHNRGYD